MATATIIKAPLYTLSKLPYGPKDLEPYISEQQLSIHHDKHHLAYVNASNDLLEKLYKSRSDSIDLDMKATLKALSFNLGGIVLHEVFWGSMAPASKVGVPGGAFAEALKREFGSFDRFKKEFTQAAVSVEGSGWAVLSVCDLTLRPTIMQVEKHNVNLSPDLQLVMALDVWEHAYYLDYKNERAKFVDSFWNIANWNGISKRWDNLVNWISKWQA